MAEDWYPKEGEQVKTKWGYDGPFITTRSTHRANLGVKIGGILCWYEVADLKPIAFKPSSAPVDVREQIPLQSHHDAPMPLYGALNAIGIEVLAPSGAGFYVIRFWTPDAARVKREKDIPFFGGNLGGSHDLFGPFDSEADANECALVMGVAFRPIINPQSIPRLALPAPKAVIVRCPLLTPDVIALPARQPFAVPLTFRGAKEAIKTVAKHVAATAELDEQYTYFGYGDEVAALERLNRETNATLVGVLGKDSVIHIVGVKREFTGAKVA